MSCYLRILVALDGSPDAEAALRHATQLARDQHAQLILLSVSPPLRAPVTGMAGSAEVIDLRPYYEATLRKATDALPQDVGVRTRLAQGSPAAEIVKVAEEERCDLIVMGFHGHGRLRNALVGSVSRSVLGASALPVLLMHAPRDGGDGGEGADGAEAPAAAAQAPAGA